MSLFMVVCIAVVQRLGIIVVHLDVNYLNLIKMPFTKKDKGIMNHYILINVV
jgi:hypothetical protein